MHDLDELPLFDYSFENERHLNGKRFENVSADFMGADRAICVPLIMMKRRLMQMQSRPAERVKKFHGDQMAVYYLNSRRR